MKMSCLPVSLFEEMINDNMSIKQWANAAKGIGLDGIDVSMAFFKSHTPSYLSTLKADIHQVGMPIVMATTYPDFTHPEALQRKREMDYLKRDIALCSELNISFLRVLAGQAHPQMGREQGTALAIQGLRESAQTADEYGVKLLYENHAKPGAWHHTDFSYPPDLFLDIYEGIKNTGIGINFDTGNPVAFGVNPLPLLKTVLPDVETIHVSDMKQYGTFEPTLIGTGVVPLKEIFTYLKANRYDKWLCIEEASFTGMAGIQKAVDCVRETWQHA